MPAPTPPVEWERFAQLTGELVEINSIVHRLAIGLGPEDPRFLEITNQVMEGRMIPTLEKWRKTDADRFSSALERARGPRAEIHAAGELAAATAHELAAKLAAWHVRQWQHKLTLPAAQLKPKVTPAIRRRLAKQYVEVVSKLSWSEERMIAAIKVELAAVMGAVPQPAAPSTEERLRVEMEPKPRAILDGQVIPLVTCEQAALVKALVDANGSWVTRNDIEITNRPERPGRTIQKLPRELRALIVAGKTRGWRLRLP